MTGQRTRYRCEHMKILRILAIAPLLLSGCAESPGGAKAPAAAARMPDEPPQPSSTGAKLLEDIANGKSVFEISMVDGASGLARHKVLVDGKPVWPPQGDGCPELIECCNGLSANEVLALSCHLAIGRDRACDTARRTVTQMAREHGVSPPPSCAQ